MKLKYTYLFFLIIILFSCKSQQKINKKIRAKYSPTELKQDLEIVRNSLEKNHPGVYWYISKKYLDFKFDSLKSTLKDSLIPLQFYRELAPVVASIKCGHTKLFFPGVELNKFQKDSIKKAGLKPLSQLLYFVDNNRIFIKAVNVKSLVKPIKGAEILAIDGNKASDIIKKTQSLYSSDGYNKTFYNRVLDKSFDAYYYLSYGKRDSSILTLKRADSTYTYIIKTIKPSKEEKQLLTPEEIGKKKIADKQALKLKLKNRYKGSDDFGNPLLDLKYDSVINSTAIMTVKSFSFNRSNFRKFFRESFEDLKSKNTQHLILDLRNNGGGNLLYCNRLFRYLYNQPHQYTGRAYMNHGYFKSIKYKEASSFSKIASIIFFPITAISNLILTHKDSIGIYGYIPTAHIRKPLKSVFNKDLIVITNGYSFSATSLLAANLQEVNRGTFVGEETGGGYNQCTAGSIPYVKLPHTGLKLRLPLRVIQITDKRNLYGRGVFPKYEVHVNFNDALNKRDVMMEKAKSLLIK
ncbi:S41 family peptidase [Pedobacter sp. SD-b]|uniref:S41 family peptidase n=1 Tax=Pedobacter segetis TaxID=2793069 RepID=A0ABS1BGR8_9SPHI|nr:S41 family peptidase [Pedobacter segetis]MBK0381429.1 S41 family peptidase [Pedobacter segetis]